MSSAGFTVPARYDRRAPGHAPQLLQAAALGAVGPAWMIVTRSQSAPDLCEDVARQQHGPSICHFTSG